MSNLISKIISIFYRTSEASKVAVENKRADIEDEIRNYEFNKKARNYIPDGYSVKEKKLYWKDKELQLPDLIWQTFFYDGILIIICDPDSVRSNVFGFDLHGNQIWQIDPVPYSEGNPAYQIIRWIGEYDAVVALNGRGDFELDHKTGKILRQLSGPEK